MTETVEEPPKPSAPDVRMIPLSQITDLGDNVREIQDEGLKELVASVKAQGILEPLLVRPKGTKFTGQLPEAMKEDLERKSLRYELVCGFRRRRAAQLAGLEVVPCIVRDMTPDQVQEARLVENLQREDLDAVEEAGAFRRYLETTKQTQAQLALKIGKSQPYIANRLRLLELRPEVQEHIRRGILSPSAAEVLLEIPKEASGVQGVVAKEAVRKSLPVKEIRREVDWRMKEWTADQSAQDATEAARKAGAKRLTCPLCGPYGDPKGKRPDKFLESEGRPVLQHKVRYMYDETHRWYADTGEPFYTPAERKELERQRAEQAKARRTSAKKGQATKNVKRDYAVFFSRARINAWAQALLEAHMDLGLTHLDVGGERNYYHVSDFAISVKDRLQLPVLKLSPAEIGDGNGGKFFTRVQVGGYQSTPSDPDNVAEGAEAAKLEKQRRILLAFQAKEIGVKQAPDDLWPTKVGDVELGQKVRIGPRAAWSSYVGKQGEVLAFDVEGWIHGDVSSSNKKESPVAILNIAAAHKRHFLTVLEHLEVKKP